MSRDLAPAELDDAIATWRRDGYAHLPGVADPAELDALRARYVALTTGILPDPGLFFQPDTVTGRYEDLVFGHGWTGPDTPYRKVERLERDPLFFAWLAQPRFADLVRRVLPGAVTLYRATVFAKAPRTGSNIPFHQDGGRFWGLDRDPELQLWTALDDAPVEAGCLEVVPGSHRWGLASPMGGLVPAALVAERAPEVVQLPARAGDVVLIHNLLWHRSGPNTTDAPRRAFTACYLAGDTRCTRTRRAPRVFPTVWALGEGPRSG